MANISFQGNVASVKQIQYSNDGKPRIQFSAAEGHRGKVNGEWADTGTTWYNVTVFGYAAEDLAEVLREGAKQRVAVSGRLSSREYEKDGVKRSSLDVVADTVGLVPAKAGQQQPAQRAQAPAQDPWAAPSTAPANPAWGESPAF